MQKLKISDFDTLKQFDKIVVTGPPRSGTTIAGLIISDILNYKFIDETYYDGNNINKFLWVLGFPNKKMVIQTTAFTRDLHVILNFTNDIGIVLIRRNIEDILESFENSKKFKIASPGMFASIDENAQKIIAKHYNTEGNIPETIYSCFENNLCLAKSFELNYDDLSNHKLFVNKEERRKNFTHIKQVKLNDPDYLARGII